MSRIKGRDTKIEMLVRKFLFSKGFRYRLHDKKLPGKPDIILKKYNTIIFVNGCFWHKHNCKYFVTPKTDTKKWMTKIEQNIERDKHAITTLENRGFRILVIWECELNKKKDINTTYQKILNFLH